MKERYGNEVPKWLRLLGAWRINRTSIDFKWGYFAPKFGFDLKLSKGGYFSKNWELYITLIFGSFMLKLPFDSGLDTCNPPRYGIGIHGNTFWIYTGGKMDGGWNQCNQKWITWDLPWFSYIRDGHWIKDKSGEMILVDVYDAYDFKQTNAYTETHPYRHTLRNGDIQTVNATMTYNVRVWHRKWFPFVKLVKKSIDITFDQEVGEERGSWKGGYTGCSYDMLPNETMYDAVKRMEIDSVFN